MKLKGDTNPIINVVKKRPLRDKWTDEYAELYKYCRRANTKRDYVSFHKQKLGKQLTCFNGNYRYWVWEGKVEVNKYHTAMWRIFVSNKSGIGFEVDTGREDAAIKCWNDYKNKIGMDP